MQVTLSQLSNLTQVKPRTLQFWTSSGVLQPDSNTVHGGPGVRRQYPIQEVELAAILAELSEFNIQVGTLHSFAEYVRRIIAAGRELGFDTVEAANAAIASSYVKPSKSGRSRKTGKLSDRRPAKVRPEERLRLRQWVALEQARAGKALNLLIFKIDKTGKWNCDIWVPTEPDSKHERGLFDVTSVGMPSFFVIDLNLVLSELHQRLAE